MRGDGVAGMSIRSKRSTIKAFEFGDIDPAFVDLIRKEQDYDESDNYRFHLVEDGRSSR